jgi:hypothetical protein
MTITEKRERIIREVQNLPEEVLDKLLASIEVQEPQDIDATFEKHLDDTTIKYKKVWEALS